METVIKKLRILFFWPLITVFLIVFCFELTDDDCGLYLKGLLATDVQFDFLMLTIMELVTLAFVVLALRLFKIKKVEDLLKNEQEKALLSWGRVRLAILYVPLVVNVLFYYLTMLASFGYLAIIILICLPFVYPSKQRCISEIEL